MNGGDVDTSQNFLIEEIAVEPAAHALILGSTRLRVEPRVMHVLVVLAMADEQVVTRADLLDAVWGEQDVGEEVLSRSVSLLRKALRTLNPTQRFVETVPKSGYRLRVPVVWQREPDQSEDGAVALTDSEEALHLYVQGKSLNARINGRLEIPIACDLLTEAVQIDPAFAEAHAELSHTYTLICTYVRGGATLENLENVEKHARLALELKPDLAFAMVTLAIALFTRGQVVEAIELNIKALEIAPDEPEVVMRLGYFYAAIGLSRKAIPILERAVKLDPAQGRNIQVLALAKLANGDLEEADVLAKRAIDLQHAFAYDTYAAVAFAMGKYDLAFERTDGAWEVLKWMFDEAMDQTAWSHTCRLGTSSKREDRLLLASMLVAYLGNSSRTPEVPLMQGVVRCGDADTFFHLVKHHLLIGRHGCYLCMWADTEPCRDIYLHADFLGFAHDVGFMSAWNVYGMPDKWAAIEVAARVVSGDPEMSKAGEYTQV